VFVPSPVSLGGEISGGCLGRYVIGRLSVSLPVAVREVGSGRASAQALGIRRGSERSLLAATQLIAAILAHHSYLGR